MATMTFGGVTYFNGKVPSSLLAELEPKGQHGSAHSSHAYLRRDAAAAWNRAIREVEDETNLDLTVRGWARSFEEQENFFFTRYTTVHIAGRPRKYWNGRYWYLKPNYASAAAPGFSNHGWGLAVDVLNFGAVGEFRNPNRVRAYPILKKYGWTEAEGRRVREPWHLVFDPGTDRRPRRKPTRLPVLHEGDSNYFVGLFLEFLITRDLYDGRNRQRFNRAMFDSVKRFQEARKIKSDGVVGRVTWAEAALGARPGRSGVATMIARRIVGLRGGVGFRGTADADFVARAKAVQRWLGVTPDAKIGRETVDAIIAKG